MHYEEQLQQYIDAIQASDKLQSKYHKKLFGKDVTIDVYDVLNAYGVDNPAIAHAIKKLLMAGQRGYKDFQQDLQESIDSIERAKDFPPIPF